MNLIKWIRVPLGVCVLATLASCAGQRAPAPAPSPVPLASNAPSPVPLASSAAPTNGPVWVNRGSGAFNDSGRVFYGVGLVGGIRNPALARSSADGRARVEIATQFRTWVRSMLRDYQSSITNLQPGQRSEESQLVEQANVQVVNVELTGVRIVDHWVNPADGTVFALAKLDMGQAMQTLNGMQQLSQRARDYIRQSAEQAFDRLPDQPPSPNP